MMRDKKKSSFESFNGVYCSGFFIPNDAMFTAMTLLFDKIYIMNNLEYVIEFAKKYRIVIEKDRMKDLKERDYKLSAINNEDTDDPLASLTEDQKFTAFTYIYQANMFLVNYKELLENDVLHTNLLSDNRLFDVEEVEKGKNGEKNKYRVSLKPLTVTTDGLSELNKLIDYGCYPVLGDYHVNYSKEHKITQNLAALLAMKSVNLVLPKTKSVDAETILEARYKLADYLPPFWSSMIKLSSELKNRINTGISMSELTSESRELVESIVRPALIDLKRKVELERKNWFYKILAPAIKGGIQVAFGNPQMTTAQLVSAGINLGMNISDETVGYVNKVNSLTHDSGLTYLLRLNDELES